MTDLKELVTLIDQYYDALTQYAFLDSKEERDNNPYLIEIINYIMLNGSAEHTITTEFHGQLTPYEYVVKMREMLFDSCEVIRESVIPVINVDMDDNDDVDSWITIDDDEYETQRKEEMCMIREYYNTLVELFTMV
jgi:hypothetical protein